MATKANRNKNQQQAFAKWSNILQRMSKRKEKKKRNAKKFSSHPKKMFKNFSMYWGYVKFNSKTADNHIRVSVTLGNFHQISYAIHHETLYGGMFSCMCTVFGSLKTVSQLNLNVFLISFIALISLFFSLHSFGFHSSFLCLISYCLSPCENLNSTPLVNLTFAWNGVSWDHTKSNKTQQNIKYKTILLWFIAHGNSSLYYACPECSLATTTPCVQGELVPRGLLLLC